MRRYLIYAVCFSVIFLTAACSDPPEDQSRPTDTPRPLPTLAPAAFESAPTPTLSSQALMGVLPTPQITRADPDLIGVGASSPDSTPETGAQQAIPSATPTATPVLDERLAIGEQSLAMGDYGWAVEQYSRALIQKPGLDDLEQSQTLMNLGYAYLADERFIDAATVLNQLIALEPDQIPSEVHFWLGQAYLAQSESLPAIESFEDFLIEEPELGGYVYPLIARAHQALGEESAAIDAFVSSLESPTTLLKEVETRLALADAYLEAGETEAAVAQYDAIHDLAETEALRGQATYLAGMAELAAGHDVSAYERFQKGVMAYPAAYESYLGLVELVKAEQEVEAYQRGLVDYHAAAYAPAIEVFQAYIAAPPEDFKADTRLYLALSHEALGDLDSAYAELNSYAVLEPNQALLEQAKMRTRAGDAETAIGLYQRFLDTYPDDEEAPFAAWWRAALTADLGEIEAAIDYYVELADNYPEHNDAPEALYMAADLARADEDWQTAIDLWTRAAMEYASSQYGSASLLALLRTVEESPVEAASLDELLAQPQANVTYEAFRARDLVMGNAPFAATGPLVIPVDDSADREAAEAWLAEQFELDPTLVTHELSEELMADDRLIVGRRLWQLGLLEEAKRELESLRQAYVEDPLHSYQLSIFFRDLGIYRSSIIAAATILRLADAHELGAPRYIGRLTYPLYYAESIFRLAEQYGFDPHIQFSLVRQESLFESFARSGAAAQGLSQVIPETGAWIAEQLQWPNYENDDLYKPYVGLIFGAYYLGQQLDYFNGDVHAALAAYNAGPGNAIRWYDIGGDDIDSFVDVIDFGETKTYVKRIYAGYNIYSYLYDVVE